MLMNDEDLPAIPALKNLRGASERKLNLDPLPIWQDANNREVKTVGGYC